MACSRIIQMTCWWLTCSSGTLWSFFLELKLWADFFCPVTSLARYRSQTNSADHRRVTNKNVQLQSFWCCFWNNSSTSATLNASSIVTRLCQWPYHLCQEWCSRTFHGKVKLVVSHLWPLYYYIISLPLIILFDRKFQVKEIQVSAFERWKILLLCNGFVPVTLCLRQCPT